MKKYLLWTFEVAIWGFIIIILVMGLFLYKKIKMKQKHSYHVFFSDTNGINEGAPVKIMGKEIGYVSNVKVVGNDEIFISFVITSPNTSLPNGTIATVETTGIVGSRSLELYPPSKNEGNELEMIVPRSPNRVQGAYENSSRIAETLYAISNNVNNIIPLEQIPFIKNILHEKTEEAGTYSSKIDTLNDNQTKAINSIKNNQKIKDFNKKMEQLSK